MNQHRALQHLAEIRERMAETQVFRGFRSAVVAISGVLALLGALVQPHLVPTPAGDLERYLALWVGAAVLSVVAGGLGLLSWSRSTGSGFARERARLAAEQVVPSLVVGALLTGAVLRFEPDAAWMLPGLWSLVFSLGVFALRRLLSPEVAWVGAYYVVTGVVCLFLGQGDAALAPWQMALCFGGGQLLAASVLHFTVERPDAASR